MTKPSNKKLYLFEDCASSNGQKVLALSDEQLAVFYWFMEQGFEINILPLCDEVVENLDADAILAKWRTK